MAVYLTKEKKDEIFAEFGGSSTNTGSIQGQIALYTFRIKELSEHLRRNKKDFSCKRTLLSLVGRRKSKLQYLAKKDIEEYRSLIKRLGLRR